MGSGPAGEPVSPGARYLSLRDGPSSLPERLVAHHLQDHAAVASADEGVAAFEAAQAPGLFGRRRAAPKLLSLAVMVALAAVASFACWGRRTRQRRPASDASALWASPTCFAEDDVDYWTNRPVSQRRHVKTAKECFVVCEGHPRCGAWTWGKARHLPELTDMCFLMELGPGELPNKTYRAGVVSGLACSRDWQDAFDLMEVERWLSTKPEKTTTSPEPPTATATGGPSEEPAAPEVARGHSGYSGAVEAISPAEVVPSGEGEQTTDAAANLEAAPSYQVEPADDGSDAATVASDVCGPVEEDVDYWTWSSLGQLHSVQSAGHCLQQCALLPSCASWTWGKARGVEELSDVCFLKGWSDDIQDTRHETRGVSSGLCHSPPGDSQGSATYSGSIGLISRGSNSIVRTDGLDVALAPAAPSLGSGSSGSPRSSKLVAERTTTSAVSSTSTTERATTRAASSTSTEGAATTSSTSAMSSATTSSPTTTTASDTIMSRTTTPVHISLPEQTDGVLFCFAVMMPDSEEQSLLVIAFQNGAGIFECDARTIYSSVEVEVAPDVVTHRVNSDLHCESGGEFGTALNLEIFLAVWQGVVQDGDFGRYEWTVKVDPDSVFFPSRLRAAVQKHPVEGSDAGVYLNNCQYGLHGPIEVFSRAAVKTWYEGTERCLDHFWNLCSGDCNWGEDIFIDQCLWKVLGARREDEDALLVEDHCDPPEGWRACEDNWHIAFHPFKNGFEWMSCLESAKASQGEWSSIDYGEEQQR